jgi:uncharacterized delta-60 repeat protein
MNGWNTVQGTDGVRSRLGAAVAALLALAGCAGDGAGDAPGMVQEALASGSSYTAGLDPTFAGDGRELTPLSFNLDQEVGRAVAVRGFSIVTAGSGLGPTGWSFVLARHRPDGSLDSSFGLLGKAAGAFTNTSPQTGAYALAIQPDGRIVAAGQAFGPDGHCFALARYQENGALDRGFGASRNGTTTTCFSAGTGIAGARAVALDSSAGILVAGTGAVAQGTSAGLVRYRSDGTLDPSFGDGGHARGAHPGMQADSIVVRPDGRILVGGHTCLGACATQRRQFAVEQYLATGVIDPRFGVGGIAVAEFFAGRLGATSTGHALALQSSGAVVLAGEASYQDVNTRLLGALVRWTAEGKRDPGFGDGGQVTTDVGSSRGAWVSAIRLSDDSIVVAGRQSPAGGGLRNALAHFLADGRVDRQWDDVLGRGDGVLLTSFDEGPVSCFFTAGLARDAPLSLPPSARDAVVVAGSCRSQMAAMRFAFSPAFSPF